MSPRILRNPTHCGLWNKSYLGKGFESFHQQELHIQEAWLMILALFSLVKVHLVQSLLRSLVGVFQQNFYFL